MKLNAISAALAGAFTAGVAGQALALNPTTYNAANAVEAKIAGATAQDGGVLGVMRLNTMCVAGSLDVVQIPSTATTQKTFAYFCTPALALAGGATQLVVYKQSGGSGDGVANVANNTGRTFANMTAVAANIAGCTSASVAASGVLSGYRTWDCPQTGNTVNVGPDAGISDVEPGLLTNTAADVSRLDAFGISQVVFGVAVSKNLYAKLQTAQGLGATDAVTDMPSLTTAQLTSIFDGTTTNWSQITDLAIPAADGTIFVARRSTNSGTQTMSGIYFLNGGSVRKCTTTAPTFVGTAVATTITDTSNCATAAGTIFRGGSSLNVVNCLHDLTQAPTNKYGIGILTTECNPNSGCAPDQQRGSNWRFIKIDGFAPTLVNVALGNYRYFSEGSFQYRNATAPAGAPTGDVLTVLNAVRDNLRDVNVISEINVGYNPQFFGRGGLLAKSDGVACPTTFTEAAFTTNPQSPFSKSSGAALTNCAPAAKLCPVPSN